MLNVIQEDPPDNRILECAEAGNVDYIISGDRHLLRLKQHGDTPIIKVADFHEGATLRERLRYALQIVQRRLGRCGAQKQDPSLRSLPAWNLNGTVACPIV